MGSVCSRPSSVPAPVPLLSSHCCSLPQARLKSDAVKQEVDRNEDMLRSCLRAVDALTQIPSVETCTRFGTFITTCVACSADRHALGLSDSMYSSGSAEVAECCC